MRCTGSNGRLLCSINPQLWMICPISSGKFWESIAERSVCYLIEVVNNARGSNPCRSRFRSGESPSETAKRTP